MSRDYRAPRRLAATVPLATQYSAVDADTESQVVPGADTRQRTREYRWSGGGLDLWAYEIKLPKNLLRSVKLTAPVTVGMKRWPSPPSTTFV
jgi:hypothetical protein